jgi:hypothetical protein
MRKIEEIRVMQADEVKALFDTLPSATMSEMDGEFLATGLDQGSWLSNFITSSAVNLPGRWLGKAFTPELDGCGVGYNWFQIRKGIRRTLAMKTNIKQSSISQGESFHLDYAAVHAWLPRNGGDEIRKLDDGIYLGFGWLKLPLIRRPLLFPFLLEGPVSPFVHQKR